MQDEIALFIDFENIRYSLLNVQRREPDPQELIAIARRFGTVMVARAYADWTRQPEFFKGSLTAAMIDRVDCPAKVRERVRPTQPYYQQQQGGYERQQWRESAEAREYPYEGDEEDEEDGEEDELDEDTEDLADEREEGHNVSAHDEREEEAYAGEAGGAGAEDVDAESGGEHHQEQYSYPNQPYYGAGNGAVQQTSTIITQSTVDLNMLMDIIETVFDRPNINTFVLMTGDRDFTRISARLKLRLNKRVIVCGVPGTVSRDLISAAEQFIPLSYGALAPTSGQYSGQPQASIGPYTPGQGGYHRPYAPAGGVPYRSAASASPYGTTFAPVESDEPGFIQFLDYIDRHWSWRTIGGVANFIGDPYNPKNRFRGRLTRDTARELLITCIEQGILEDEPDGMGNHNLRLNREHPKVAAVLADLSMQQ